MDTNGLRNLVSSGGGVMIDANKYTPLELQSLVGSSMGMVIIKNVNKLTLSQCQEIAEQNPGNVIFDFATPTIHPVLATSVFFAYVLILWIGIRVIH